MKMQDVEIVCMLPYAVEHKHVIRDRIPDAGVEPQAFGTQAQGWPR